MSYLRKSGSKSSICEVHGLVAYLERSTDFLRRLEVHLSALDFDSLFRNILYMGQYSCTLQT